MSITQEELERRIKELANTAGWNPQGSATTGLRRRNTLNIEDLNPRDINPTLGLHRPTPGTPFETPEEEPAPLPIEPETDVEDLGNVGDAPAPEGQGVGLGVMSPMVAPFALSVIAKMMGVPIPVTNPYALIKTVMNAIGMEDDPTMTEDEAFEDINTDMQYQEDPVQFSEFSTDTDVDPDVNPEAYSEFSTQDLSTGGGTTGGGNIGPSGFGESGSPSGTSNADSSHEGVVSGGDAK